MLAPLPYVASAARQRGDTWNENFIAKGNNDVRLRSTKEVTDYGVAGSDGDLGRISDFIIDDQTWSIRYLVIDTSPWWTGKHVLLSPSWVGSVSWPERKVFFDLPRDVIKNSPEWTPGSPIDRDYEERLHDRYRKPAYWVSAEDDRVAAAEFVEVARADRAAADAARAARR